MLSALTAVSQTALAVVKGLSDPADEVGSAGEAVQIFANDLRSSMKPSKNWERFSITHHQCQGKHSLLIEDLLGVAIGQIVQPFQRLLQDLQPLLVTWRDSLSRMKQLGLHFSWAFGCKIKVLFFHGALNALMYRFFYRPWLSKAKMSLIPAYESPNPCITSYIANTTLQHTAWVD